MFKELPLETQKEIINNLNVKKSLISPIPNHISSIKQNSPKNFSSLQLQSLLKKSEINKKVENLKTIIDNNIVARPVASQNSEYYFVSNNVKMFGFSF